MPTPTEPIKGRWYYDTQAGRKLQVTWIDEDDRLVEARYEDGHTKFYPQAEWQTLQLEPQADEDLSSRRGSNLSNEDYRRATGWAEKSPDDFPDG